MGANQLWQAQSVRKPKMNTRFKIYFLVLMIKGLKKGITPGVTAHHLIFEEIRTKSEPRLICKTFSSGTVEIFILAIC
jgi:hypothetical protein